MGARGMDKHSSLSPPTTVNMSFVSFSHTLLRCINDPSPSSPHPALEQPTQRRREERKPPKECHIRTAGSGIVRTSEGSSHFRSVKILAHFIPARYTGELIVCTLGESGRDRLTSVSLAPSMAATGRCFLHLGATPFMLGEIASIEKPEPIQSCPNVVRLVE